MLTTTPTTPRRPFLVALALGAALLAPIARADDASPLDKLPPEIQKIVKDAIANQDAKPAKAEELPSLDQLRVWYRLQKEKLGENNEDVKNLAAMIRALEPLTFNVSFAGGTVAQYIDAIRKAYPAANIVTSGGLDAVTIPTVSLTGVSLEGALKSLPLIAQDQDGDCANLDVCFVDGVASVSMPERTYSVFSDSPSSGVWNTRTITADGGVSVSDVTGAIETALSVFQGAKPEVRLHEATGILIVRGTEEQLSVVNEVINELSQAPDAAREAAAEIRHYQSTADELQRDARTLELQVANLEQRRKSLEPGSEADAIDAELFKSRRQLDGLRAKLQAASEALDTAKARAQEAAR